MIQKGKTILSCQNEHENVAAIRTKRQCEDCEPAAVVKKPRKPFADTETKQKAAALACCTNPNYVNTRKLPPNGKRKNDDKQLPKLMQPKPLLNYVSCFKDEERVRPNIVIKLPKLLPIYNKKCHQLSEDEVSGQDLSQEIMEHLYNLEIAQQMSKDYLRKQNTITPHIRAMLVDWLIQVQDHLDLSQESLYLAVMIVDRILSMKDLAISKIQLLGITALFTVAKMEGRFPPKIKTLIHLTDNAYNYSEVIVMERFILKQLKFNLIMAEPMSFLNRFMQFTSKSAQVKNLSMYLLDTFLLNKESALTLPSYLAAAALCLARAIVLGHVRGAWNKSLEFCTTYSEEKLKWVVCKMISCLVKVEKTPYQGAKLKFSSAKKYGSVSKLSAVSSSELISILSKISTNNECISR